MYPYFPPAQCLVAVAEGKYILLWRKDEFSSSFSTFRHRVKKVFFFSSTVRLRRGKENGWDRTRVRYVEFSVIYVPSKLRSI